MVSAEPAGAFQTLFFAWNAAQHNYKQNKAMTKRHAHFKLDKWGAHFNDLTFRIFSVTAGLIVAYTFRAVLCL